MELKLNTQSLIQQDDIQVGYLINTFYIHKLISGTFLPEVATEQEWTQAETLENLIRKSGYYGQIDSQLLQSIHLTK